MINKHNVNDYKEQVMRAKTEDNCMEYQLELLANAIVAADTLSPRRWMAKYGAINTAEHTHLNQDYKTIRKKIAMKLPQPPVSQDNNVCPDFEFDLTLEQTMLRSTFRVTF